MPPPRPASTVILNRQLKLGQRCCKYLIKDFAEVCQLTRSSDLKRSSETPRISMHPPSSPPSTLHYTVAAAVAAAALFYIFGPTLLPNNDFTSTRQSGAVGLVNAANDCFINSVLQAIAGSPVLRRYLEARVRLGRGTQQNPDDANRLSTVGQAESDGHDAVSIVTVALSDIVSRLHDPALSGKSISPIQFIRALEVAFKSRLSRRQQDAQEMFQIILERMDDESTTQQRQLTSDIDLPALPFKGSVESHIQCQTCSFKPAPRTSDFTMLSLTVPQQSQTSIDTCFDDLLKQEIIEEYKCQRCVLQFTISQRQKESTATSSEVSRSAILSELETLQAALKKDPESVTDDHLSNASTVPKRRITKFNRIARYPAVLVVHLSRSIYTSRSSSKNDCKVSFAEELRLGGLASKHVYRLVSVVTHRGRHNSGHYETFRRQSADGASKGPPITEEGMLQDVASTKMSPTNPWDSSQKPKRLGSHKWWGISDHHVRNLRTKDVLSLQQAVYLLIYEKVE